MNSKRIAAAIVGVATITTLLAGCATGDAKPTPSATATVDGHAAEPVTGTCVDGVAVIADRDLDAKGRFSMGDCDTVYVNANGATITLGAVETIGFDGTSNRVTYTGDKPKVTLLGENTLTPAKK